MGVVGKYHIKHPSGIVSVDVVDLGDSQTGHSFRIRTPKGIKEFNLVTLDDTRASAWRVNTPWGTLSPASDGRNVIEHEPLVTLSYTQDYVGEIPTQQLFLGRTEFNKVSKLSMDARLHLTITCGHNGGLTSGFDRGNTRARLRAVNVSTSQEYTSGEVSLAKSVRHDIWAFLDGGPFYMEASAVLSGLPHGVYDVYMLMNGWRSDSEGHLSNQPEGAIHDVLCRVWREHTK